MCNKPYKGFDAFRHALFGDAITVERKIAAAGTSSYALKGADGRCAPLRCAACLLAAWRHQAARTC